MAISDLVSLSLRIERDATIPEDQLRRRDRVIGQELRALRHKPGRQLQHWLEAVAYVEDQERAKRAEQAAGVVGLLLFVVGLVFGIGAAVGAFYYTGARPINILPVLALFVVLPLLLLLGFVFVALPSGLTRRLPGIAGLQDTLILLYAGVLGLVMRLLPQRYREAIGAAMGQGRMLHRIYGYVQKWLLLRWSQSFSVAFMLGALAWFVGLLTVSDLAFTWSTTLQIEDAQAHEITTYASLPWATVWPEAQPSVELIEKTRYFRVQEQILRDGVMPQALGGWWPFLLASMIAYGLLPRLVAWFFTGWRLNAALRWSFLHTPGAAEVLDRLNHAVIQTRSLTREENGETRVTTGEQERKAAEPLHAQGRTAVVINWSQTPLNEQGLTEHVAASLGFAMQQRDEAGGGQSIEADNDTIVRVAAAFDDPEMKVGAAVVVVKAWEPPTMELCDFIEDLRGKLGSGKRIIVAPYDEPGDATRRDVHEEQWRQKMKSLGDPWLSVRPLDHSVRR
ncbi:MAG: DUF2868 domain-containing protein, partial [Firmicutes bacterium]|nr:DUF2868 domain-containing protein [Bacillota bacterium]